MGSLIALQELCEGKSIAIVGNAQSLLDMNLGEEIDSHDIVVRINQSVSSQKHILDRIGHKCDIYTASGTGMVPVRFHKTTVPKLCFYMTTLNRDSALDYFHFFPEEMWYTLQKELNAGKDIRPSTGLMTIYMILNATKFKSLNIYGFDFWETKTFYNPSLYVAKTHRPKSEKEYILDMISKYDNVKLIGKNNENSSI